MTVGASNYRTYIDKFRTMMANLRAIPGASNMRAIVSTLIPEYVAANATVARVNEAINMLPEEVAGVTLVQTPTGYQKAGEAYHMTAAGARAVGSLWGDGVNATWTR